MGKNKKKKTLDIGLRSEEVQELMGRMPSHIVRFGIPVILCFVLVLLGASYFITYPDIETIPIKIVSENFTMECKSPIAGSLVMREGQIPSKISAGQVVVSIVNNDDTFDIASPISGRVFKRTVFRDGESIDSAMTICIVVPYYKFKCYGYIHVDYNIKQLLTVHTKIDVEYKSTSIKGVVTQIADLPNSQTGLYDIELDLGLFTYDVYDIVGNTEAVAKVHRSDATIFDKIFKSKNIF